MMNGRFQRLIGGFLALSCIFILLPVLHASAAPGPATEAYVSGVELNASTPYWQNGSTMASAAAPAGGWNAYFDAATSTLKLQDALIEDLRICMAAQRIAASLKSSGIAPWS